MPTGHGHSRSKVEIICDSDEYKEWRFSVYERDNFTCQCCGYRREGNNKMVLNAHHKENFANYPELRFDIGNGITLCNDCHNPSVRGSFHNVYGTLNNNIEQLNEYIINYKIQKVG